MLSVVEEHPRFGPLGRGPALVGFLLHEVADRDDRLIDLLVEPAVDADPVGDVHRANRHGPRRRGTRPRRPAAAAAKAGTAAPAAATSSAAASGGGDMCARSYAELLAVCKSLGRRRDCLLHWRRGRTPSRPARTPFALPDRVHARRARRSMDAARRPRPGARQAALRRLPRLVGTDSDQHPREPAQAPAERRHRRRASLQRPAAADGIRADTQGRGSPAAGEGNGGVGCPARWRQDASPVSKDR